MKWLRKKKSFSPSSSSPSSSIITRVLPVSWFSKFKQKTVNPETRNPNNNKNRNEFEDSFPSPNAKARSYSMDEDDPFWKLSFSNERTNMPARRSTGGFINPAWYDEFQFPASGFKREAINAGRREEYKDFNNGMVLGVNETKDVDHQGSGKCKRRGVRAKKSGERGVFPVEPEYMVRTEDDSSSLSVSNFRKQPEISIFGLDEGYPASISEKNEFKEVIKVRSKQKSKVRTYSPRTECRIRALEEMKKARLKMEEEKRRMEEEQVVVEGKTVFKSFAVAKSSFDPRRDFRESMVEMIREKGIRGSEDLEELLACYLALNSDEYHDIIINVFRKVWFELKGVQHFDY